jgi:hypothetical protein
MNFQGNSVVGGYVYRGGDEELNGKYVFADFISRKFWMFDPADPYGTVENVSAQLAPESGIVLNQITTFFEDALGELYIGTLSGNVFRLETAAENGQYLAGDFQLDGYVDSGDLAIWQESYGLESEYGDADGDDDFDGNDFLLWQQNLTPPLEGFPESAAVPEPAAGVLALLALAAAAARRRGPKPWPLGDR